MAITGYRFCKICGSDIFIQTKTQKGTRMIIKTVNLETVCGITSKLPENTKPEFAVAGKSNVGKSTLINTLMNRKSYARTSATPGKTQTINYYNVNDEFYLVDLPGYGYATAGVKVKQQWGKMIENYLRTSKMLQTVFLLVDIRHKPSANDKMMYDWIVENGMDPVIVATKKDKLKKSQVQKALKVIREGLDVKKGTKVVAFSAETKEGREEIWTIIGSFLPELEASEEQNGDILWELSRP